MRRKSFRKKVGMPKRTPWAKPKKGIPAWVKAIPESQAHGSGTLQKRLWRVTSDFVRIRDYYRYGGICVASGRKIAHWREGQAGHFISYTHCNGLFKFDIRNIHLQSASSNSWGRREDWQQYEATLIERYGVAHINLLEDQNKEASLKFTNEQIVERMAELLAMMKKLPEQPDYFERAWNLYETQMEKS